MGSIDLQARERPAFEAFWRSKGYPSLGQDERGRYVDLGQQMGWESWLAARVVAILEAFSGEAVSGRLVADWFSRKPLEWRSRFTSSETFEFGRAAMGEGMRLGWIAAGINRPSFVNDHVGNAIRQVAQQSILRLGTLS